MEELWRPVVDYPEYDVSTLGRVKRVKSGQGAVAGRILSWHTQTSNGYPNVRLVVNGKAKGISVHKLVTRAFFGPKPDGLVTRHLDGNKQNNRIDNLRYGTMVENARDKVGHGTNNPWYKLSPADMESIKEQVLQGAKVKDLAVIYGVHKTHLHKRLRQSANDRRIDKAAQ